MLKKIFFLLHGIVVLQQAFSQEPVHRVFNNLNGLPSNTVYNIIQDKKGFIWLAHDKGLSRYDGKQIVSYKNNSAQGKSLSNLLEIDDAIYCQDFTGNYFKTNTNNELEKINFSTIGPFSVVGNINKKLVSIKYDSIRTYELATKKRTALYIDKSKQNAYFFTNKEAYFLSNNKVMAYDGNIISTTIHTANTSSVFSYLIKVKNNFYAVTKNTYPYIHLLQNNTANALPHLPKGTLVQDVCIVNNEIWVCTSTGAYCFNENFSPKYNGQCFFNNNSISKVIQDKEGNYWLSTLNNGVLIVPNIYSHLFSFNNESFTAICNYSNNILIGTNSNSILNFENKTKTFIPVLKLPNNHEVLNINIDNANKIFVSSNQLNILHNKSSLNYQLASKSVTQINNNLYALAYASDFAIINTKPKLSLNEIPNWLKTSSGIIDQNVYKIAINKGRCRDVLYHLPTQTLYAATANGLFYFSPKANGEITYQGKSIYASNLTNNKQKVYIATFAQSVFVIDENTKIEQLQITNNAIYKLRSHNNFLFLVADEGLIQYDLLTKQKRIFTNADGLPKAELKDVLVKNNKLYIATSLGLVTLDIDTKKINEIAPVISVNAVLANGEKINWQQNTSFAPNKNNITIHFSALSFKSEDGITVKYKINNELWQNVDANSRIISLPALSSGKYEINIKAINEDGVETKQPTTIHFTIKTPFYKQWWFFGFLIFFACLIVYLYFRKRLQNQLLKNNLLSQKIQLEKDLQQSMMASIKSQMNPHFLFNALNTIQSYIYTNDKENASQYLGKFSTLTRMILEMSSKEMVAIAEEIKALQLYLELEQLRFEDKLSYQLIVDESISIETSYIPSMLIQPYVENAIKHGLLHKKNDWQLVVQFEKKDNGIQVTIDDNGIGRKRSEELNRNKARHHKSFATNANQKRLEILNKGLPQSIALEIIDKADTDGNILGTLVKLFIPFYRK